MKFGGHRTEHLIAEGGFAQVFRATTPTGSVVALKVARPSDAEPDALPRMRREIEVQSALTHPNVMPILLSDAVEGWFTMPLAEGNLDDLITRGSVRTEDEDVAITIVTALLEGLSPAHDRGLVHRDVNPANALRLGHGEDVRWVVADWGIVRRSRGTTTIPRTQNGGNRLGTLGYGAPELWTAAHDAAPSADVYSVARVAARLLTGRSPVMNAPLRPTSGAWRTWVDECTQENPDRRPQSAAEAKSRLAELLQTPAGGPLAQLAAAIDAARSNGIPDAVWHLAVRHREDFTALEIVTKAPQEEIRDWARREPAEASILGRAVCEEVSGGWGRGSSFDRYKQPLRFVLMVLRALAVERHVDELQDLATVFFPAEECADRWVVCDETARWLVSLRPPSDAPVAHALHAAGLGPRYAGRVDGRTPSRAIMTALGL